MKAYFFLVISFSLLGTLHTQPKHDYHWLFGYDSNSGTPEGDGANINFNANPIEITYHVRDMNIGKMNSSMSDSEGNLLFYSNGCYIADATDEVMLNGDGLNPGELHDQHCPTPTGYRMRQGLIILPSPGNPKHYYIFHKAAVLITEPAFDVLPNVLYYTKIDMEENNGLGAVVEKNQIVIEDSLVYGELTAVKHENDVDWWVVTPRDRHNTYYSILFTSSGIDTIINQYISEQPPPIISSGGQAVFSPDGTKYVRYNPVDDVLIFDFDRSTGLLSNLKHVVIDDEETNSGGAAISPNSRFLYCSALLHVYQFDIEAEDIQGSMEVVATFDGYADPLPANFFQAQLAPDCRIYINSSNTVDVLHTINYPDEKGVACDVAQHSIQLPTYHAFSIPNFPNYRLGEGPVCDTSFIVATSYPVISSVHNIKVYPNPAREKAFLNITLPAGETGVWQLYNALGQQVRSQSISSSQQQYSESLVGLFPGIYFYTVSVEGEQWVSGKLVVE